MDGTQSMTIFKDTRVLGEEAISLAIKLANGEKITTNGAVDNGKIDVPSVLLEPQVVTQDNLKDLLVGGGYITEADLK